VRISVVGERSGIESRLGSTTVDRGLWNGRCAWYSQNGSRDPVSQEYSPVADESLVRPLRVPARARSRIESRYLGLVDI
jgi:hypothetical protein